MSISRLPAAATIGCHCPVCRAEQTWSDTCRRCQCDLTLLRATADTWEHQRRCCLANLRRGWTPKALAAAERCWAIAPNETARRLLIVCRLLAGDWPGALAGSL
ncbi:MAG: hypothetical protein ACC645_06415 [Pirellulales bacterium]